MKTLFRILAVLAVALAVLGPQVPAGASPSGGADVSKVWIAIGEWSSLDETGCIRADTYVWMEGQINVFLWKYDQCSRTRLLSAYGSSPIEPGDFEVAPAQTSAHLKKTVHVEDEERNYSADIELDLVWTPTVALNTSSLNDIEHGYGCRSITHEREGWHYSDVSGTLTDGATNFIPEPSTYGEFYWGKYVYLFGCQPQEMEAFHQAVTATSGELLRYRLDEVDGEFSQVDPSGCLETRVMAWAGKENYDPGTDLDGSHLTVFVSTYDGCNGEPILSASAFGVPLTAEEFRIQGNVAALKKIVTVEDWYTGRTFDVALNWAWKAAGPAEYHATVTDRRTGSDCEGRLTENWGTRPATIVGTVAFEGIEMDEGDAYNSAIYWDRLVLDQCG